MLLTAVEAKHLRAADHNGLSDVSVVLGWLLRVCACRRACGRLKRFVSVGCGVGT